jgi:hypothetical protein
MADELDEVATSQCAPVPGGDPRPTESSEASAKEETFAAVIRNGLSNGPIAQSPATWDHLNTRLGEIVAALMKEI